MGEKRVLLKSSFESFKKQPSHEEFNSFKRESGYWVHDLAIFLVLTEIHGNDWTKWPEEFKRRNKDSIEEFEKNYLEDISFHIYLQYLFEKQWSEMREYCHSKGVELFGDIPIFISHHSMDVWRHPKQFKITETGDMLVETGPPRWI